MKFSTWSRQQIVIAAAVALWIPAICYGIDMLLTYSSTPGQAAEPPREWPVNAPLEKEAGHYTLLMFAHPQCQCTSASLGELAALMAHTQGRLDAFVLFYLPSGEGSSWAKGDLWRKAGAIPGVKSFEDRDAAIAQKFGVFTSGQTLLYSPGGRLLFQGGITAFRGHSGDNAGRSAIVALVDGEVPPPRAFPVVTKVFGCALRGAGI